MSDDYSPILQIDKSFFGVPVLKDINLDIPQRAISSV